MVPVRRWAGRIGAGGCSSAEGEETRELAYTRAGFPLGEMARHTTEFPLREMVTHITQREWWADRLGDAWGSA